MALNKDDVPEEPLLDHLTMTLRSLFRAFRAINREDVFLKVAADEMATPIERDQVKTVKIGENGESSSEVEDGIVSPGRKSPNRSRSPSRSSGGNKKQQLG